MKRALKITGIIVGVLVLLLVALGVALPFIINPNHFKPEIAQAVKDRTGRALNIEGDIKFSIFPWLGVQIGPMELANATGFSSTPFAAINETDVHVHFWPLLHGEVEVGEVKLDGLSLDLERDANGHGNWQDLANRASSQAAAAGASGEGGSAGNEKLSVAGLEVTNGQVRWQDAQKHQQYTASNFTLTLGAFVPGQATSMDSAFDIAGTNPEVHGHASLNGTLTADLAQRIYSADDAKLNLQLTGSPFPGGELRSALDWRHAVLNSDSGTAALNGLELTAYGLTLHLEAQGKDLAEHAQYTGSVKLDSFSPREVLKAIGRSEFANTRDSGVYTSAAGSFHFEASSSSVSVSDLNLQLDDTHLTGKAGIRDFKDPGFDFDVVVDKIDADRYLPARRVATAAASSSGSPTVATVPAASGVREPVDVNKVGVPLRTLRSFNLEGRIHVGQFKLLNLRLADLDMNLSAHHGLVRIDPVSATLYGGSLAGNFQVDASDLSADSATVSETLRLKGVQVGGLGMDLAGSDRLSGELDLDSSTRAEGRLVAELRRTVGGHLSFDIKKGTLEGVNVTDAVLRAYDAAKGRPPPPAAPQRTEFAAIHGSGNISHGVLSNRDFSARLPYLELAGEGKVDLAELTVDYNLKGRFIGTPSVGRLQSYSELQGAALPIHLSGTLSDLSVRPDLAGLVKGRLEPSLDKKKAYLKKKLKGQLQGSGGR